MEILSILCSQVRPLMRMEKKLPICLQVRLLFVMHFRVSNTCGQNVVRIVNQVFLMQQSFIAFILCVLYILQRRYRNSDYPSISVKKNHP